MAKSIRQTDPNRADHRMIEYILRIHFKKKVKQDDCVFGKISRVFEKAGGSWTELFEGSSDSFDLLKKIIRIALKRKMLKMKK
jgi:hypothetical protein